MTKKHLLCLVALLLLTSASLAHAQSDPVATHLDATVHPLPGEANSWLGEPINGTIDVALCWGAVGGSNPKTGNFTIVISGDAPHWVNVTITPAVLHLVPPQGPTQAAGCTEATPVLVTMSAPDSVLPDSPVLVNVTFAANETQWLVGNFAAPMGTTASFSLHTVPSSGQPPDDDDGDDGDDGGDGGDGDDGDGGTPGNGDDDTPGPGDDDRHGIPSPAVAVLIALVAAIVALRRRS